MRMTTPLCNCAHVQTAIVWTRGAKEPKPQRHDRCTHPSGPHPMHEGCPWMAAKTQGATEC